ncbi:MAG: DUF6580 family putative transport protein [Planctomycetota bacterium]
MFTRQATPRPRLRPTVLVAMIVAAALSRLLPHPPNFTPLGAMALFGGAYFASRIAAVVAPLAAMFLSDCVFAVVNGWSLGWMTLVIYACIAASAWLGMRMRANVRPAGIARGSILSALLFYLVVNFAVWAGSGMYPPTGSGLVACYVAAIPFLANTLAGYAAYGSVLFGGFALLQRRFEALAPPTALQT